MKTHGTENPAWDDAETHNVPRYRNGEDCPAFTLDLFDVARKLAADVKLTDEEQKLHEHVGRCSACRNIFDSALWFLQPENNNVAQCAGAQLAGNACPQLERLRKVVAEARYKPVSLYDFVAEVVERAEMSSEDAESALELTEYGGLDSLNRLERSTVHSVRLVGIDERYAKLALECQCLGLLPDPAIAPRQIVPTVPADEPVCELLERLIREFTENSRENTSQTEECQSLVARLFAE